MECMRHVISVTELSVYFLHGKIKRPCGKGELRHTAEGSTELQTHCNEAH
jgi:hypothetical protein